MFNVRRSTFDVHIGAVAKRNIEHPTSNIEHRTLARFPPRRRHLALFILRRCTCPSSI